jgi:hypothetical protein
MDDGDERKGANEGVNWMKQGQREGGKDLERKQV